MSSDLTTVYTNRAGGIFSSLFGPISKEYCFLFYIGMVLQFVLGVMQMVLCIASITHPKRFTGVYTSNWIPYFAGSMSSFVQYFGFRLLYTMCIS